MRWSAVFTILVTTFPAAASDTGFPDYLPSETKAVFGIRVRDVIDLLQSQSFAAEWHSTGARLMAQTPLAGFDPLKDLDEVLITSTGEGENPPVLVFLRGRFDVDRLAAAATSYHGVPILEDAKKTGAIAILDASTAIAGDGPLVRAAVDRHGSGAGIDATLAARIEPLRTRYSIWGIGDVPKRPSTGGGEVDPMASVDQFEFGAQVTQGLELSAKIHARTPEDAEKMASSVGLLGGMLKGGQASPTGSKFDMHTKDGWLELSLTVPQEALNKAIQEQRSNLQSAVMSRLPVEISSQLPREVSPAPAVKPAPKPATPPGGRVVKDAHGDTMLVTLPGKK